MRKSLSESLLVPVVIKGMLVSKDGKFWLGMLYGKDQNTKPLREIHNIIWKW